MQGSGTRSFMRFVLGFALFIMLSFSLTVAVGTYAQKRESEKQVAAALRIFLGLKTSSWTDLLW